MLFVCAQFSGCNQISNLFLTDEKRFYGSWSSEEMLMGAPTEIVFSANGTFTTTIDIFYFETTYDGTWVVNEGTVSMYIDNLNVQTDYTYLFSDDNTQLTLTTVESGDSFILRKQ